jgi:hypothetical protein
MEPPSASPERATALPWGGVCGLWPPITRNGACNRCAVRPWPWPDEAQRARRRRCDSPAKTLNRRPGLAPDPAVGLGGCQHGGRRCIQLPVARRVPTGCAQRAHSKQRQPAVSGWRPPAHLHRMPSRCRGNRIPSGFPAHAHALLDTDASRLAPEGISAGGRRPHSSDRATGGRNAQTLRLLCPGAWLAALVGFFAIVCVLRPTEQATTSENDATDAASDASV